MASIENDTTPPEQTKRVWELVGLTSDSPNALRFKMMTFNVLAQTLLENNLKLLSLHKPEHLLWETRFNKIIKHIIEESPDVLCLQEVEVTHLCFYKQRLEDAGYSGTYKKKTGARLIDGCAIFIKNDVFQFEDITTVEFFQPKVSVMNHHHVGIIVQLSTCSMPSKRLVVANTHLLCDPKMAVTRLKQLKLFLAEVDRMSYEYKGCYFGHLPIIFTGDLNSHPDSEIIKFMEVGQIDKGNDWHEQEWISIGITDNSQHLAVYGNNFHVLQTTFEELDIYNSKYCGSSSLRTGNVSTPGRRLSCAIFIKMFSSTIVSHTLHFQSVYDTKRRNRDLQECYHESENCNCTYKPFVDYVYYNSCTGLRPLERLNVADADQFPKLLESTGSDHQSLVVIFELNAEKPY